MGRAAVHEVAARLGMDPREVASRLVALSATGLPLLVGVECDPARLRAALAPVQPVPYGYPHPPYQAAPSGPVPAQYGYATPLPPPGSVPPGPHSVPSGPHSVPSGPYPVPPGNFAPRTGPPSAPFPSQSGPPSSPVPLPQADAPMSTWGPPQTSTWARGDQPPQEMTQPTVRTERPGAGVRQGKVGTVLQTEGLEGEKLAIQLVEVVDPADYLFTAAGYRLQEGERSVVVHTELTNRGQVAFQSLPDLYLVLVTPDGTTISKAPVSLSSRPPHRIGVPPGETAGGHTVYVVPENIEVTQVRWSPRPDEESRALTWTVDN
ncbi:AsnC family protein [Actinophytocola xanthii]|uniref:AsnC family protein n=1 Tax=Actinophytocola xanthii TaxID=1912961 RepID=A0A1Q8CP80_9PSEU|nr:AsnC family protein [Actinophytocola xanthii]OLF16169.1 AsnC family protein [Actinophytocola xanthii]